MALGSGTASWLTEAAAVGTRRIRAKMAEAVTLAKLHPSCRGRPQALAIAAIAGRFGEHDLVRILTHQRGGPAEPARAGEGHSLQPGTAAWSNLGLSTTDPEGEQ